MSERTPAEKRRDRKMILITLIVVAILCVFVFFSVVSSYRMHEKEMKRPPIESKSP